MVENCKICGSENFEFEKSVISPYIDSSYSLFKCNTCKSHFFDKDEHTIDLKNLYNFEDKNHSEKFIPRKYWKQEVNRIVNLVADKNKPLKILDIGCRTGDFLMHWDKRHQLFGVELNSHNAKIAKKRGINVYCDFVENINFNQKFDVITCYALLEHIPSPDILLAKITSILNTNGVLVILIPSIESKMVSKIEKKNIHWHMFTPPEHLSFYSREFLDNYMTNKGLIFYSRRFTSGGMLARYSRFSPFYNLLKNPTHEKLKKYYASTIVLKSSLIHKIITIVLSKIEPLKSKNKQYYDHMFSYYLKKGQ